MDRRFDAKNPSTQKLYAIILAELAWASIGLQLYITDLSALNFFSYFTTLCNLLIAISLTISALLPKTLAGNFFSSLSVKSAIAIYIFIVSLVYNLVLRGIWILTGLAWLLDNMVHVVIPILYILYWFLFRPRRMLKWQDGIYWLIFPSLYLVYSLIRGSIIKWYPYPFLNATKLGYEKVLLNICLMLSVFLIAGLILTSTTRLAKNKD